MAEACAKLMQSVRIFFSARSVWYGYQGKAALEEAVLGRLRWKMMVAAGQPWPLAGVLAYCIENQDQLNLRSAAGFESPDLNPNPSSWFKVCYVDSCFDNRKAPLPMASAVVHWCHGGALVWLLWATVELICLRRQNIRSRYLLLAVIAICQMPSSSSSQQVQSTEGRSPSPEVVLSITTTPQRLVNVSGVLMVILDLITWTSIDCSSIWGWQELCSTGSPGATTKACRPFKHERSRLWPWSPIIEAKSNAWSRRLAWSGNPGYQRWPSVCYTLLTMASTRRRNIQSGIHWRVNRSGAFREWRQ